MKLITKELEKLIEKYPIYSQEGKGFDAQVITKFFNPITAKRWFVTEGEKDEKTGDYLFFGFVHSGNDEYGEFGYFALSELESLKLPYNWGIERDRSAKFGTLNEELKRNALQKPSYWDDDNEQG